MKRICIAAVVELALVACNGHVTGEPSPTPETTNGPVPAPTSTVTDPPATPDDVTYDAPQVKPVLAAQCTQATPLSAAGDLPLPAGVDGVLEYSGALNPSGPNWGVLQLVVGTPCATASDKTACHATISALAPPPVPGEGVWGSCGSADIPGFLILTSGDTVTKVTTGAQVIELYGPVASTAEAALVAQVSVSNAPTCKEITQTGADFDYPTDMQETPDGGIAYIGPPRPTCTGRLTEGSVEPHIAAGVGGWLAGMAALERSAVDAFARMARELRHHRAPESFVARAEKARADEVRHARAMARQATRFGGRVPMHEAASLHVRDLEAIALENAIEGCARETFGAVIGAHQARAAGDEALRAELAVIAREEAEHAQLSWDLAAWIEPLLSEEARARVQTARHAALQEFGDALGGEADEQARIVGLRTLAGLPSRAEAEALAAATRAMLS